MTRYTITLLGAAAMVAALAATPASAAPLSSGLAVGLSSSVSQEALAVRHGYGRHSYGRRYGYYGPRYSYRGYAYRPYRFRYYGGIGYYRFGDPRDVQTSIRRLTPGNIER